ncbi:type I toxin-antitoxin system Ibs family toxin [Escherichia coli]|nr:type I toxin-antitoxin system Ibs family toxin [Escherichia coli]
MKILIIVVLLVISYPA